MNGFLLLRNISVENANAIAGQTWGFPAVSHFLGYMHALQRTLAKKWTAEPLNFTGCAIISHQFETQTHQANKYSEHVFALSRNPLTKEGNTAPFVEEGRMNMTVSLLIGIEDLAPFDEVDKQALINLIRSLSERQRLAGGTITSIANVRVEDLAQGGDEQKKQVNFWLRTLLPGFALVARPDLLTEHAVNFAEQDDPEINAWLDTATLHLDAERKVLPKPYSGWIRPITVGYRAISPVYNAGQVAKSRDGISPVCFTEYAYSLGQWLSPHRITHFNDLLWKYQAQPKQGWYLCQNDYPVPTNKTANI